MHPIRLFAYKTVTSTLVQMSAKLRLNFFYYAKLQCIDHGVIYKIFRSATIKIETNVPSVKQQIEQTEKNKAHIRSHTHADIVVIHALTIESKSIGRK